MQDLGTWLSTYKIKDEKLIKNSLAIEKLSKI